MWLVDKTSPFLLTSVSLFWCLVSGIIMASMADESVHVLYLCSAFCGFSSSFTYDVVAVVLAESVHGGSCMSLSVHATVIAHLEIKSGRN